MPLNIKTKITDEQFDMLVQKFLMHSIDDVINGTADEITIQYYCAEAAYKIHKGEALAPKLAQCLAFALYQISTGADPAVAFGLKKNKKGRKNTRDDQILIALCVWHLVHVDNYTADAAIYRVMETFSQKYDRIKCIYYTFHKEITSEYQKITRL